MFGKGKCFVWLFVFKEISFNMAQAAVSQDLFARYDTVLDFVF